MPVKDISLGYIFTMFLVWLAGCVLVAWEFGLGWLGVVFLMSFWLDDFLLTWRHINEK
jgi:hypothetical protein